MLGQGGSVVQASSLSLKEYYGYLSRSMEDSDGDGLMDSFEQSIGTSSKEVDTDHDGYSDGDEYNEFGTDPLKSDGSLFPGISASPSVGIRLVTLPARATVEGTSVYVKGLFSNANTPISLSFESDTGLAFKTPFDTDERGVFHKVVSLDVFCIHQVETNFSIKYKNTILSTIHLHCAPESYGALLSNIEFNGQVIQPRFDMKPLTIVGALKQGFKAQLSQELEARGYFSSIVTSAQILSDTSKRMIVAFPSMTLDEGRHQFILTLREPINETFYDPLVIPFDILYDKGGYLKAYLESTTYGIIAAVAIGSMGMVWIRSVRKKKRARIYDGDY